MSRSFNGSNQYFTQSSFLITAYPFSISLWAKSNSNSALQSPFSCADNGSSSLKIIIFHRGDVAGDPIEFYVQNGVTTFAQTTAGYTPGQWHHICAVGESSTSRAVYLDGGNKGTSTTSVSPYGGHNVTTIGVNGQSSYPHKFNGDIAEVAVWNAALTDADALSLAKGFSPLFIRPESLQTYWPLIRGHNDRVGAYILTEVNTPGVSDHVPKIIYPVGQHIQTVNPPVIGGVFNSPIFR